MLKTNKNNDCLPAERTNEKSTGVYPFVAIWMENIAEQSSSVSPIIHKKIWGK